MIKSMVSLILGLLTCLPSLAADNQPRGNNNPITLYNNTSTHVRYSMKTFSFSADYAIKRHSQDVYHTKYADEYLTIEVGECKNVEWKMFTGEICRDENPQPLQNCVANSHYNGNLIKTITINSLHSCTVTCLDGGTTSCKQSG